MQPHSALSHQPKLREMAVSIYAIDSFRCIDAPTPAEIDDKTAATLPDARVGIAKNDGLDRKIGLTLFAPAVFTARLLRIPVFKESELVRSRQVLSFGL